MRDSVFVSDLHGKKKRYELLTDLIRKELPRAVFMGGDLLPGFVRNKQKVQGFFDQYLFDPLKEIRDESNHDIPCFVILGNDDPREFEEVFRKAGEEGTIHYINQQCTEFGDLHVCGYNYVPPTPFQLKDWEKYDVSRFTDVGAISPEQGTRTVKVPKNKIRHSTMAEDLEELKTSDPKKTIYLFHSPPYETNLDRADLDGKKVNHAPLDVHVGSIAIKRFIEENQPLLTLHGHVHETVSITDNWRDKIGDTECFTAVPDNDSLTVIRFDPDNLHQASREVIPY